MEDQLPVRENRLHGTHENWFAEVVGTLGVAAYAASSVVAIDARSGRLVAATPKIADLFAGAVPDSVDELVDRGIIARPDLTSLRAHVETHRRSRNGRPGDPVWIETALSWEQVVRLHLPDGSDWYRLTVVHHVREQVGGELLVVSMAPEAATGAVRPAAATDTTDRPAVTGPLWSVLDSEARIVGIDPGSRAIWAEAETLVGTLSSLLLHPEDLAEILPSVRRLLTGRAEQIAYTARVVADGGHWVTLSVTLRRLITSGELLILSHSELVEASRRLIPADLLSERETAITVALFDGFRVTQIAERDGVSVNTLRNQLKSIYRKLDVGGQAELLSRFHRPGT